jgi:hypothetical protein
MHINGWVCNQIADGQIEFEWKQSRVHKDLWWLWWVT